MAERTNAQLLKSCEVQASVGSNPTPSAPAMSRDIEDTEVLPGSFVPRERVCIPFPRLVTTNITGTGNYG